MTTQEFRKSVRNKNLSEFTKEELMKACEFEKYKLFEICSVAKLNEWDDVITHANSFEQTYTSGWYKTPPTVK